MGIKTTVQNILNCCFYVVIEMTFFDKKCHFLQKNVVF